MNSSQSSSAVTLYGLFPYDRGGKARWLMREMNLEYTDHWLDQESKEIESEAYLAINPMGRIPAMKVGNQSLFESGAICAFLADEYLTRGMAPALNSPHRMQYQQWMYFAASTIDPFMTRIMIIEDIPAGEVLDEKLAALMSDFKEAIGVLNNALSKSEYLVANQFSAADICVGYHLYWCKLWPEMEAILNEHPQVTQYLTRLQKRPAAEKAKVFSYEA